MSFVLLLDRKNASDSKGVYGWLTEKGFVTSLAFNVLDALEELSDFTVRDRSDCVLLEIARLTESFDAIRSTFQTSSGLSEIIVLGLTEGNTTKRQHFANNLDQLHALIGVSKVTAVGV